MIKDAYWIGMADGGDICPEFIKHFKVKTSVREAMLTITAIGVYEARINNERIGDFILAPGCTAYNKRLRSRHSTEFLENYALFVSVG